LRALVTGAGGFAGSHLCEFLLAQGAVVCALVMPGDPLDNLREVWASNATRSEHLRVREADIADDKSLVAAVADTRPDRVYHLAAVSSVRQSLEDPAGTFRVNTVGTRNLLEVVRCAGIRPRILVVSSAEAYGDSSTLGRPLQEGDPLLPVSPYGASKAAAEMVASRYAREFNLEIIRVRPFTHTGPRHSPQFVFPDWARQLAEAEAGRRPPHLHVGNLDVQRDISDVRDVVGAYFVALERGEAGSVYNVCSGRAYALRDILQVLTGLSRLQIEVRAEPARLRPQDLPVLVGNPQTFHACTGWKAAIPLRQTLEDLLSYWRSRLQASA
jgi:GDP-4-dehydro-6-deoxy-D-mannose reductase